MARWRERRVRLSSSSPFFDVFPLLLLPMIYYNIAAFAGFNADPAQVMQWLTSPAFKVTMFSGTTWSMTQSDIILGAAMGLLFIEILKSVGSPMLSLVNHGISVMTLL